MNLKTMLAPAIMGMAFMGLISTVNVAIADDSTPTLSEVLSNDIVLPDVDDESALQALIDQAMVTEQTLLAELTEALNSPVVDETAAVDETADRRPPPRRHPCAICADRVANEIEKVVNKTQQCNNKEAKLEQMRELCKSAKGVTPSSPFLAKCNAVTHGVYGIKLQQRQACRDELAQMVKHRNDVEHECYGAPLYCGMWPQWPY